MKKLSQLTKLELLDLRSAVFEAFMDRYADNLGNVVFELLNDMEIDTETSDENLPILTYLENAPTLNTEVFVVPSPTAE